MCPFLDAFNLGSFCTSSRTVNAKCSIAKLIYLGSLRDNQKLPIKLFPNGNIAGGRLLGNYVF